MPRMDITTMLAPPEPEPDSEMAWAVDIPMGKQTYRYEFLVSGTARIYKTLTATDPAYTIKDGICSCPAAMHSKACKHIKPVVGFMPVRVDNEGPGA